MRSRSSSYCLALFLFIPSIATQTCSEPRSANCCENDSTIQADSSVPLISPTDLNCCFEGNLCCYSQGCVDSGMGNWSANNGYASVSQSGNSNIGASVYSVLESPWVNFSKPSCVEFTYFRRDTPYQLQVFLAFNNVEQPCLMEDQPNAAANNQNRTARFSIKPMTGKIQFRVLGGGATSNTQLPKLYDVTVVEDSCVNQDGQSTTSWARPQHTSTFCTQASVITMSSTTRHPTTSDRTCPTSCTDGDIPSPDSESDNSAAAIAGIIVPVVVLIVVVIIVVIIVYKRKRRQSKADDENRNTEDLSMTTGGTNIGNTATERQGNPFSRRDGDYTDIDLATTPSSNINPYELAEDATNTNGSLGPNLQRLKGSKEDDYSRIDEAQPAAAHSEKNSTPERPNPNDVYSVVNKPGKKTPTPEYSLAKIVGDTPALPNPNDVYSVVNKKGKTFDPATKPGQPDTEYNTISHNGNNTSSQKAASGDATPDTYNRISAVPSLGLNEKGRATTKPEDGLLTDDYNKLNLAGNGSMKEKNGAAGAAYDHVRNDPDDAYSKARIGKRNVVIDSDYHHLKP
ncbi:uncharacterized protein [Littorina saxatilis]|uniref:uncharacterized protein n=1 Tax=Littorina saxatilis TaxID=31220 RepID=UPI0038B5463A